MNSSDGTRVDLHAKILDEDVVGRAKARGLDVLVYAPHFTRLPTIRQEAEQFSDEELTIVPAREIFTGSWRNRRHVLALGLQKPVPDFISLEGAIAEFDRQDATVLVPHPTFFTVSLTADQIERYQDVIDAIETYNPKHLPWHNRRARTVASELDLPTFASSYAHRRETVGEVWTTFGSEIATAPELCALLEQGADRRLFHRGGSTHQRRCLAEFAHLGYENTWEKIDRVLLSGMEATHPGHVAYGGQFDDVRVD